MENNFNKKHNAYIDTLRRHLGEDIVFTNMWADAHDERALEESELFESEVSGDIFVVGNYTIRWSVCLYRDDDTVHYTERVPAGHDAIDKYRREGQRMMFGAENGVRRVESVSAKCGNSGSKDWHHICLAATSHRWFESIDFIATLKLSASATDDEDMLFILNQYNGDSFCASYWYKLSYDGTFSEYGEHPYDPESYDASWRGSK